MQENFDENTHDELKVNQKAKAKIFEDLFSDKNNLAELIKELDHDVSKNNIRASDIKIIETSKSLVNSIVNDIACIVNDDLIVIIEAQMYFILNDILRFCMYAFSLLVEYVISHNKELHSSKKFKIPRIKLFMLYGGTKKDIKKEYSLRELFFDGDRYMPDMVVRVITPDENKVGMIGNQYLLFCKEESDLIRGKNFLVSREAFVKFIDHCIKHGILSNYLKSHRKEIINMFELNEMTDEQIHERILYVGREEGIEIGIEKGREEGIEIGREEGREEGIEEGIEIGREEGREEGMEIGREEGRVEERSNAIKETILLLCEIGFDKTQAKEKLIAHYNLDQETAEIYIEDFWDE